MDESANKWRPPRPPTQRDMCIQFSLLCSREPHRKKSYCVCVCACLHRHKRAFVAPRHRRWMTSSVPLWDHKESGLDMYVLMFCACVCTSFTIIFPTRNKQRHTSATLTGKHSASYHIYSGQIWRSECMWCGAGQTMTDWTFQSRISSINELPSRHISSQLCVDHRVCWLGLISAGKKGLKNQSL